MTDLENEKNALNKKYEEAVESIGSIMRDIYFGLRDDIGKEKAVTLLRNVMHKKGLKRGTEIKQKYGDDIDVVRNIFDKLYDTNNIKFTLKKEGDKLTYTISSCPWGKLRDWNMDLCAIMDGYEIGLLEGLDIKYAHKCPQRRSLGHDNCKVEIERKI